LIKNTSGGWVVKNFSRASENENSFFHIDFFSAGQRENLLSE
jgi:hypothetical protein